ncbi:STAS domain-containing protein [Catellatospora sp. NPDC049111]|uniref:STAS domain-containing protein n=1 Tax=Catellatospora sp. NPDC049111 TaxID=3155271 RepID=UPI0033D5B7C9
MPDELRIRLHAHAGSWRLMLSGVVGLQTAETLEHVAAVALRAPTADSLCLDMAAVTSLDTTGLATLAARRREADLRGLPFRIVRPSAAVAAAILASGGSELRNVLDFQDRGRSGTRCSR